jgi:hypothetical protein
VTIPYGRGGPFLPAAQRGNSHCRPPYRVSFSTILSAHVTLVSLFGSSDGAVDHGCLSLQGASGRRLLSWLLISSILA